MRLKVGKCLNAFRACRISRFLNSFCCCFTLCCVFQSKSPSRSKSGEKSEERVATKQNDSCRNQLRLIYYTFIYNENNDILAFLETCFSPFVDAMSRFIKFLGYILIVFVLVLTFNMIYLFYAVIFPQIYQTTWLNFIFHFIFGHWIAVNTVFHYVMGVITDPGRPPKQCSENVVTMCKRCVAPKPPRTHHCSICNQCVLKMDHHCPWFNNCIGFYNHRYFFMFCLILTIDCIYLNTFGFYYYQLHVFKTAEFNIFKLIFSSFHSKAADLDSLYFKLTTVEFFLTLVAGFAVFVLMSINAFFISQGSTNIEIRSLRIPCFSSTSYRAPNPYDLGFKKNWQLFLGFHDLKTFITRVILPSSHKPVGDGIDWSHYLNKNIRFESSIGLYDV